MTPLLTPSATDLDGHGHGPAGPPANRPMVQPLRVLYSFPHPLGLPGIGTTAYHQVISLRRQGIEAQTYCTNVARPLHPGLPVRQTMALGGQRLPPRVVGVKRARYWHDRVVATALAREYFDVAHAWPGAAVRALRACRRLGIPGLRGAPNTNTAHACDVVARETARLGLTVQRNSSHAPNPRLLRLEDAEYGAATALLVSRQSGAVLTHGEQGLLHEVGDVDTLAAHLQQLERDRSMLERLRCRALAARKSLTWDHAGTILHAAYERFRAATSLLCTARYVVTDRLHAHILCLLLGIPHSVFDNSYGKVSGTFEAWTSDSDLVHWATSADEALERCGEFVS